MKNRITIIVVGFVSIIFSLCAQAQVSSKAEPYFTSEEMPDMLKWYKAPPKEGSEEYIMDIKRYYWGRSERLNPERAAIAVRDAHYGLSTIINEFSSPFGLQISMEHTPAVYTLLRNALATTDSICKLPKSYYMRPRPFMVFNERTLTPNDEPGLRKGGSYPSGHTILGWSAALLLTEINPEAADTLLARGLMYGESRVIVGAHWQSDVNAGQLAASVAYAKLHTSERFVQEMEAAKKEFAELKGKYPPSERNLSNDTAYIEYRREIENLKQVEQQYDCIVQQYPYSFDKTTGLKMLYIRTNDSPYNVSNAVDHVILTNEKNEVVYIVKAVMRHDRDLTDESSIYGLYVIGKDIEEEIEISNNEYLELEQLLYQMGRVPEFTNCTDIRMLVTPQYGLIPFSSVSNTNSEKYKRFFVNIFDR